MTYKANRSGIAELLMSSWMDGLVERAADKVASNINVRDSASDGGETIEVQPYAFVPRGRTSKRHVRSITVRLPNARLLQAREGILTRAAAAAGLEVTEK